jgi:hypothetical protein
MFVLTLIIVPDVRAALFIRNIGTNCAFAKSSVAPRLVGEGLGVRS